MPLLGENAIRFKASESDRMDVASPIAARMRKAADLTAQATSFDDFERLDPEISAGDTLINFGQQADFCIWQGLETRAQRHLTSDGDSITRIARIILYATLSGGPLPTDAALLPLTPPAPKRPTKQKWLYGNRPVKPRFVVAWSST